MKKLITSDIKRSVPNIMLFVLVSQVLLLIEKLIFEFIQVDSMFLEYVILFVASSIYFILVMYTLILLYNYATKPIKFDLSKSVTTTGYLFYRFINLTSIIMVIIINYLIPLVAYTDVTLENILNNLSITTVSSILFVMAPIYTVIVCYYSKQIYNKIIPNIRVIISIMFLFIVIFIAGYLYFFNNSQLGSGVLLLTIPIGRYYISLISTRRTKSIFVNLVISLLVTCSLVLAIYQINNGITNFKPVEDTWSTDQTMIEASSYKQFKYKTQLGTIVQYIPSNQSNESMMHLKTNNFIYNIKTYSGGMANDYYIQFTAIDKLSEGNVIGGDDPMIDMRMISGEQYIQCYTSITAPECEVPSEILQVIDLLKGHQDVD